jgi:hypothetical protein
MIALTDTCRAILFILLTVRKFFETIHIKRQRTINAINVKAPG